MKSLGRSKRRIHVVKNPISLYAFDCTTSGNVSSRYHNCLSGRTKVERQYPLHGMKCLTVTNILVKLRIHISPAIHYISTL